MNKFKTSIFDAIASTKSCGSALSSDETPLHILLEQKLLPLRAETEETQPEAAVSAR